MSLVNELRTKSNRLYLITAAALLVLGILLSVLGSGWSTVFWILGIIFLAVGTLSSASSSLISGMPWLLRMISRHTEPDWNGEIIHTDGSEFKIRYTYDHQGNPRFVAKDICAAIGARRPNKGALKWGGAFLLIDNEHACFSREAVTAYLTPLAIKNHAANRLLIILRNEIFRKLDLKQERLARNA